MTSQLRNIGATGATGSASGGGMDPATMILLSSLISGGVGYLNNKFGGQDSGERVPFGGTSDTAEQLLQLTKGLGQSGLNAFGERMSRPVSLRSSYVQSPPTFAGGGLPQPLGVTGEDPAFSFMKSHPSTRSSVAGQADPGNAAQNPFLTLPGFNFNTAGNAGPSGPGGAGGGTDYAALPGGSHGTGVPPAWEGGEAPSPSPLPGGDHGTGVGMPGLTNPGKFAFDPSSPGAPGDNGIQDIQYWMNFLKEGMQPRG